MHTHTVQPRTNGGAALASTHTRSHGHAQVARACACACVCVRVRVQGSIRSALLALGLCETASDYFDFFWGEEYQAHAHAHARAHVCFFWGEEYQAHAHAHARAHAHTYTCMHVCRSLNPTPTLPARDPSLCILYYTFFHTSRVLSNLKTHRTKGRTGFLTRTTHSATTAAPTCPLTLVFTHLLCPVSSASDRDPQTLTASVVAARSAEGGTPAATP